MKKFTTLLATAAVLVGFASCTKKEKETGKTLNIAVSAEIKGMDPIYANDRYSSNEVGRVYEGLLEYHYLKRPYTLVPNLAESMPSVSEDGLTYTFKIRQGVLFHDSEAFPNGKGRELVAEDFVYSIKRLADPKLQGLGWWLLDGKIKGLNEWREKYADLDKVDYDEVVEGLKATGKYTLEFKLTKPFPQFLYSLAMPFTFATAREVVEKYGKEFLNHPVGTGPFVLPVFKQTKKVVYTKNPNFRKKLYPTEASDEFKAAGFLEDAGKQLPLVDKVVVSVIIESQPRWLNFLKGNVDYIGIPKDNFDSAVTPERELSKEYKDKGISLMITPSLDVTYTAFNHDLKLFQNPDLRRAMSLAYDVKKSNELFYNNTSLPAQSVVPPGIAGNIPNYVSPYRGPNIEEAKKLLAKAGYPEGKGLPEITYDCPSGTVSRQIGDYMKQQMAQIGVRIKVVTNPWPELQKKITKRQVMLYGIAWGADYPDAENFLQLLYGPNKAPGANGSGYDNPEFNKLFKTASVMQDSPERTALYEKMNRIAAEQAPWIYGVHRQNFTLRHSFLKNYMSTDFETGQAQYLNIDTELKAKVTKKL
ncbi:putative ABC transport system solute-binding protein [Halobacteriovorax marinus SJ]|uniref:ABC transport system solute-binding protein n=1 Tax=Halobacteriovorax marinus (strain ATCC BAA-682 / DSM 15412 / SJ) TaxID=862908 RepID=E1WZ77_HALMS|nr:ABC transporter substrate-binding protein [Halobacteriovorax marinus]CBW27765.1 putative ABC transport system solute-binding protein [Halobacteriovorax marinus SJ]